MVALLSAKMLDFIGVQYWPPNSLDCSPVDYEIWGILKEWVYHCQICDVNHLKEWLIREWCRFDQRIDKTSQPGTLLSSHFLFTVYCLKCDLFSSHEWIQAILSFGKLNIARKDGKYSMRLWSKGSLVQKRKVELETSITVKLIMFMWPFNSRGRRFNLHIKASCSRYAMQCKFYTL